MCKVSVIMPSLNVASYIAECMDSVLAQSLEDIEVLAIDAGSTDGTLEMLQDYACKDSRVRVIISDKKSYGYQVNIGISLASGEYIGIVETDDYVEEDMFEALYVKAVEECADYVKGIAQSFMDIAPNVRMKDPIYCVSDEKQMNKVICPKDYPELFVSDRFLWMGIYRSDFIKMVKLNETPGAAFQDIGFAFQVIQNAERAVYLDKNVYFYRQDNLAASSHDARAFRYLKTEYLYVKQFLEGKGKEWYRAYYEKLLNQCLGRFSVMGTSGHFWDEYYDDMLVIQSWLREAVEEQLLAKDRIGEERWEKLQCYLESPQAIYEKNYTFYWTKVREVLGLFSTIGNQQVVVFGCGRIGKFFQLLFEYVSGRQIIAYADNNEKIWNTDVQGKKVFSPVEVKKNYPDAMYIVANMKNADVIYQQLKELGVAEEKICIFQQTEDRKLFQTLSKEIETGITSEEG